MKTSIPAIVLLLVAVFTLNANMRKQTSDIPQLWGKYTKAVSSDTPQTQVRLLQEIIMRSRTERLAWDYFDAWRKYVTASSSRNWKQRDSLNNEGEKAMEEFGVPILNFAWKSEKRSWNDNGKLDFIKENASVLKASQNTELFSRYGSGRRMLGGCLPEFIRNDYEFCLWEMCLQTNADAEVRGLLRKEIGAAYPCGAYLDLIEARRLDKDAKKAALKAVAGDNAGNAIGIMAEGDLLQMEMDSLNYSFTASSADYEKLHGKAAALEKERKSLKGTDKSIAQDYDSAKSIIRRLEAKSMDLSCEDGKIIIRLRNLPQAKLSIFKEGEKQELLCRNLKNEKRSFYLTDTLTFRFPDLDDGEYMAEAVCGKERASLHLEHYSLSLAGRWDKKGYAIYLAKGQSGKPVAKADVTLKKNGKRIASTKDFVFGEGFCHIPKEISDKIDNRSTYQLECSFRGDDGKLRMSHGIYVGKESKLSDDKQSEDLIHGNLYTDREAYRPGETVHANVIFYREDRSGKVMPYGNGESITLTINDSEGKEIHKETLTTSPFGSAHTSFTIPEGLRNGWFSIDAESKDAWAGAQIRVDDFVLPESIVEFDGNSTWYIPGDMVEVNGKVSSYSGHSTAAMDLSYEVYYMGKTISSGPLSQDRDGHFTISFASDKEDGWQSYTINVKTVDSNGQTQEYSTHISLNSSFSLELSLQDRTDAQYGLNRDKWNIEGYQAIGSDSLVVEMNARGIDNMPVHALISYSLLDEEGKELAHGSCNSGEKVCIDLKPYKGNIFTISAESSARGLKAERRMKFIRVRESDSRLESSMDHYFRILSDEVKDGEDIRFQFGASSGDVWAVLEISGRNREILYSSPVHLEGRANEEGSLQTFSLPYPVSYPDAVHVNVFFFKDGESTQLSSQVRRTRQDWTLPLEWSRFEDRSVPGKKVTIGLKTLPDVEIMASVYDKSIDRISQYSWSRIELERYDSWPVSNTISCGEGWSGENDFLIMRGRNRLMAKSMMLSAEAPMMQEMEMAADGVDATMDVAGRGQDDDIRIREDFTGTIAFEPDLRSDSDGLAEFSFTCGDRLSTYKVMLFAHDMNMRNNVLVRDMVITIPVKLSILPPALVRVGDSPLLAVTVSSESDKDISGTLTLYRYDGTEHEGKEPLAVFSRKLEVKAKSSAACSFNPGSFDKIGTAGFKLVFKSEEFSDAMFVTVPVEADRQSLTESHSAVMLPGADRNALIDKLHGAFVNTSAYGAEIREISIMDMVRETIHAQTFSSPDLISLCNALYALQTAGRLVVDIRIDKADGSLWTESELAAEIAGCINSDGGWSWFQGMGSSPAITAQMLEYLTRMEIPGIGEDRIKEAVQYLDKAYFSGTFSWRNGISAETYLLVRSAYAQIPFIWEGKGKDEKERFEQFGKYAGDYLAPKGDRGLNGQIFAKALRLKTLSRLTGSDSEALCNSWGLKHSAIRRLAPSLEADVTSLLEYAVEHRDGGIYYPDAVMPYRGLMECEAGAHALLCNLFSEYAGTDGARADEAASVAHGIRIWLMLQKETQKWDEGPGFIGALDCILKDGAPDVRVLMMSKTYEKEYAGLVATGNGFTIKRVFTLNGSPLEEGDVLKVGDKICVEYRVWSQENRSFVRLRAFREGCLSPVEQRSGLSWGWGSHSTAYRNVGKGASDYYFEAFAEEDSVIREEFHVTQEGVFSAPVCEIECLYAPQYRANSGFRKAIESRR